MESLKLTEEQKTKLLEMCKILFPEYNYRFGKNDYYGDKNSNYLWIEKEGNNDIHWFELCINHICPKLTNRMAMFIDIEDSNIDIDIVIHPIDYLYELFKLKTKIK